MVIGRVKWGVGLAGTRHWSIEEGGWELRSEKKCCLRTRML